MSTKISINNQEQNYSTQITTPVYWCIYRITNINPDSDHYGWTYIGQHKYKDTSNPLGRYYGSGSDILDDIKLLGRMSFTREVIIDSIVSVEEANRLEIIKNLSVGMSFKKYINNTITYKTISYFHITYPLL